MAKLRWGVLGCGDVVRKRVAQAIQEQPNSELLAACRRDADGVKEFAQRFQVPRVYTHDLDLLSDPDIDIVYIATPVHLHLPQTLAAAAARKHVLVEKPMAMTTAECDQMVQACHQQKVKLGVAYYRRFYPMVRRMEKLLAKGETGQAPSVSPVTCTPFPMQPGEEGYWRVLPESGGGGALMDIGSHRLNLFLHMFGPVTQVKALCTTVAAQYQAEDTALLSLKFASGMVGSLQCYFGTTVDPDEFTVLGTYGRLAAQPLNGDRLFVQSGDTSRWELCPPDSNLCAPLIEDMVQAVLKDKLPTVTGNEARWTNAVIEKAYLEASGRKA